jgi:hypothetical protein
MEDIWAFNRKRNVPEMPRTFGKTVMYVFPLLVEERGEILWYHQTNPNGNHDESSTEFKM